METQSKSSPLLRYVEQITESSQRRVERLQGQEPEETPLGLKEIASIDSVYHQTVQEINRDGGWNAIQNSVVLQDRQQDALDYIIQARAQSVAGMLIDHGWERFGATFQRPDLQGVRITGNGTTSRSCGNLVKWGYRLTVDRGKERRTGTNIPDNFHEEAETFARRLIQNAVELAAVHPKASRGDYLRYQTDQGYEMEGVVLDSVKLGGIETLRLRRIYRWPEGAPGMDGADHITFTVMPALTEHVPGAVKPGADLDAIDPLTDAYKHTMGSDNERRKTEHAVLTMIEIARGVLTRPLPLPGQERHHKLSPECKRLTDAFQREQSRDN